MKKPERVLCKPCGRAFSVKGIANHIKHRHNKGLTLGVDEELVGGIIQVKDMKKFSSGAKRSEEKLPFHLISHDLLKRVAKVWDKGRKKYGAGNWQKGGMDFIQEIPDHIIDHIYAFLNGETTEDHLAHIVCNIQMLMHFKASYSEGGELLIPIGPEPPK